jgi:two-component system, cell cycle response regulator
VVSGSARAPSVSDFASLVERTDRLHALRAALACVVLGAAAFAPEYAAGSVGLTAVVTAGYLLVAVAAEWVRRKSGVRAVSAIGGMLLADGVYLAWAAYLGGGGESPLRFLIYLHIVAATLLASYRTGLKLALWHTLLFFAVVYGHAGGLWEGAGDDSALPGGPRFESVAAFNVLALWGMALGTAAFSSLVERELRRQKIDLQELASMAAELDRRIKPVEAGEILLERLAGSFGFRRGVVLASPGGQLTMIAHRGGAASAESLPGLDPIVEKAWAEREVLLVKRLDSSTAPRLASLLPDARNLVIVPLFAEGHPIGVLALERGGGIGHIHRWAVSMVQQFARHGALALNNAWRLEEVQRMAETDPLTGLANRRVFEKALEREIARASRTGQPVSLLMLDADHFKQYNDRFGHRAGDDLLQSLAHALVEHSRGFDTVARYGGEEFAVILPECSAEEAHAVAERLRLVSSAVEGRSPVTLSGGVATFPVHGRDSATLIEAADAALYESKRSGRDRLSLAGDARGTGMSRPRRPLPEQATQPLPEHAAPAPA